MGVIMKTLCKIVIMLLFTCTRGKNTQEMEDITEMMRDMNTRLYKAEDQLANTKIKLAETENKLMSEITRMRNPPYMHACGYQDYTNIQYATIPYSTLLYSSTNME